MSDVNITIIGAGIVGLAIARKLSKLFENIVVVDRNNSFGQESSSRNSEVIHASIYYPKGSLKSRLCLKGNEMLYEICKTYDIPFKNSGKLIIATNNQEKEMLPKLLHIAQNNGAKGVRLVSVAEIESIEPNVTAIGAIYCPTSGYLDSHKLMQFFEIESANFGTTFLYNTEVKGITKVEDGYNIDVITKEGQAYTFDSKIVINSAGLNSDKIAQIAGIDIERHGYKLHYFKGIYYRVHHQLEKYPKVLIYPVPPGEGAVGIHTTPDCYGGMRLGPHFYWSNEIEYSVNDTFRDLFFESASKYLPFIEKDDIMPEGSGIMSSLRPSNEIRDFIICNEADKGLNGLINLIGIDSPGLTASPAIAEMVSEMVYKLLKN